MKFTDDVRAFTSYSFKPQLKTVGPKYGKQLGNIRKALSEIDGNAAMDTLNEKGALTFDFDGAEVVLTKEDLLIDAAQVEGYVSEGDNTVTVVLDTNLTPELVEEGFVSEIISKIQTMSKEAGFEVMNHINVFQDENEVIAGILKKYARTKSRARFWQTTSCSDRPEDMQKNGISTVKRLCWESKKPPTD